MDVQSKTNEALTALGSWLEADKRVCCRGGGVRQGSVRGGGRQRVG